MISRFDSFIKSDFTAAVSPDAPPDLYRRVFEVSPIACVLLDPGLRTIATNSAFDAVAEANAAYPDHGHVGAVHGSVEHVLRRGGTARARGDAWWSGSEANGTPRIWDVTTTAVPDSRGLTAALLQQVEDVTDVVTQDRATAVEARTEHDRLVDEISTAQDSLAVRAEQLQALNEQLQRAGHRDRSVAQALQDALLATLPTTSHLQLAARYLTATGSDQVGGDWYDAYVGPDEDVTLTIGDVMGHDIVAAGLMGQLRNLLRALVVDRGEGPAQLLSRLDRALQRLHVDTLATAALLAARPSPTGGWDLRWSNAGHPAPMLIGEDGSVDLLDGARSALLGVAPDTSRADLTRHVPPGAVLLLYTDGLIETRDRDIDDGKARLAVAARRHHHLTPGRFLDAVLDEMLGGAPEDDVAVLAVRFATA